VRTKQEQDRYDANKRYYNLLENKKQKREYMKAYSKRPSVVARNKEKYSYANYKEKLVQKYLEEQRQEKLKNFVVEITNDLLNAENSDRFVKYE
jgi:predicted nuclease of restriction endonuclease-like (RecB) superfamily|tara:strand:+ start:221 stop:502 length:282 start_codon:yes stop_codon:yes gene_type:complete